MKLAERLVEFVDALRLKGIQVGPSESLDAAQVMEVLGVDDREQLREGLAAALIRRGGQRELFDIEFDLFFPLGEGASQSVRDRDGDDPDVAELRELLQFVLAAGDDRALRQIAEVAVDALGQVGQPGTAQAGFSAYQTLDRLRPQTLIAGASGSASGRGAGSEGYAGRLRRDEVRRSVERFRQHVANEARRRTAETRGREIVARHASTATEQVDFLNANAHELKQMRLLVQPLSRKLATRLSARRRRRRRGTIDMRRTLRRAMGTGGVPMRPVYEKPRRTRPDLVLLCDVSGSVAGFSTFTMLLVKALSDQFSRVRVFAFVNAMADVTELVKDSDGDIATRILTEAKVTNWHTSSDYGEALRDFAEHHLDAVTPRTSVIVLGDARNNNQPVRPEALHQVALRAKRIFWLNPEHPTQWGVGDSVAPDYAQVVDMHQCSNIDQLSGFVGRLL